MKKKNNLWIACICLIIAGIFVTACSPRKTATLKISLDLVALNGISETELSALLQKQILETDDDVELKDIQILVQDNQVKIEVKNISDDGKMTELLARRLAQKNTGLKIYETYRVAEIFPMLDKLDKFMKLKDSSAILSADTKKPKTLEEIYAAKKDSIERQEKNRNPFNGWLQFNVAQGQYGYSLVNSPMIGYCQLRDTSGLFTFFRTGYAENILPRNLLILTKRSEQHPGTVELYALRLKPPFNKPAMEGNMIFSADPHQSEYGGIEISMNFNPTYVADWAALTKKASPKYGSDGGFLAMVLNNEVLSAPMVSGEISNGKTSISGNFTKEEADDLCKRLSGNFMPCDLRVSSIELTSDK